MRLVIVDDEPLARSRLRFLLAAHGDVAVIGEAANTDDAAAMVRESLMRRQYIPASPAAETAPATARRPTALGIMVTRACVAGGQSAIGDCRVVASAGGLGWRRTRAVGVCRVHS